VTLLRERLTVIIEFLYTRRRICHQALCGVAHDQDGRAPFLSDQGEGAPEDVHIQEYLRDFLLERVDSALCGESHKQFDFLVPPFTEVPIRGVEATGPGLLTELDLVCLPTEVGNYADACDELDEFLET